MVSLCTRYRTKEFFLRAFMGLSVALPLKAYGQFNAVVACGFQAWTNWELSSTTSQGHKIAEQPGNDQS
jgi:hypothetical protein